MNVDHISIPTLRVFIEVFETKNMSQAAKNLAMTQPGVSQHIKSLEGLLETPLFDRISKKLLPTAEAVLLYEKTKTILNSLELALNDVSSKKNKLRGTIRMGMPIEFGNNKILPIVSSWLKKHPQVSLIINYDHAARQSQMLLDGSLDFAITDSFNFPKQIATENLSSERLILCCSKQYALEHGLTEQSLFKKTDGLDFIAYLEGAPMVSSWFKYHLNRVFHGNIKSQLMDVQGVLRLTLASVGISILPLHVISQQGNIDQLILFKGRKEHLINELNLAFLKGRNVSEATESLFNELRGHI